MALLWSQGSKLRSLPQCVEISSRAQVAWLQFDCLNEMIAVVFFGLKEENRDLEPMRAEPLTIP